METSMPKFCLNPLLRSYTIPKRKTIKINPIIAKLINNIRRLGKKDNEKKFADVRKTIKIKACLIMPRFIALHLTALNQYGKLRSIKK